MKRRIISVLLICLTVAGMLTVGIEQPVQTPSTAGEEGLTLLAGESMDAMRQVAAGIAAEEGWGEEEGLGEEWTQDAETVQGAAEDQGAEQTQCEETEQDVENEYAELAIADVSNYVNVRREAGTDSEIVGKIYDGAVAHVLEVCGEEKDWFRIVSGNVEGYIKAEFFLYGEAAVNAIDEYVTRYAVVQADRLNVREEPDIEARRIGYIDNGERVKLLGEEGEWLQVQYASSKKGYVAAEYVTVTEEFVYAKTLEEEAAELAARRELESRQSVPENVAAENVTMAVASPSESYGSNEELRSGIVEYAMQFLGNKYVHGGQSLVTGTDCSGFTSLIYAEFGYAVSRTPAGQLANDGRSIAYSEIQPGDIICYGSGSKCTHVAIYIGDGQIIHAANSRKGVVIYEADYDTIMGVKNVID